MERVVPSARSGTCILASYRADLLLDPKSSYPKTAQTADILHTLGMFGGPGWDTPRVADQNASQPLPPTSPPTLGAPSDHSCDRHWLKDLTYENAATVIIGIIQAAGGAKDS